MKKNGKSQVRCLLVRPEFLEDTFYNPRNLFKLLGGYSAAPPLGLLTVAACLPPHWELKFVDGDIEPITDEHLAWANVLMITGKGPQEVPMRRLCERARARGIQVVVGGAGPTLQPERSLGMADYVVVGEAENAMPRLVADIENHSPKGLYRSEESVDLAKVPIPRWDLAKLDEYMFVGMNFTRGCPFSCEFCAQIEIFGRKPRVKPASRILAEHQRLYDLGYRGMIDFGYDNLIGDIPRTEEVLRAMKGWNGEHGHPFCYSTEATMNLARLPRVLELMRDNDFRYVFMGIESGDPAVLERAHKGQNTAMTPEQAVRILNQHGMAVNTGLIIGFDGEDEHTASNMLKMVQQSGAFPTLVLPLHALPNTSLSRRLAREGRLFREGEIAKDDDDRTDTAATGLNFATQRPRAEVMSDLAHVLEHLYVPANHYARLEHTLRQFEPAHKFRPPLKKALRMARSFKDVVRLVGLDRETAPLFWKTLARTLVTKPGAFEMVVGSAVMNANYHKQSKSYVRMLREQISRVEQVGERAFNQSMGAS